ncbi:plasmid mobilization protein [Granulibacter bethesdensis]|uniref:plasmid mobilization protein n=1 Tax=Granulibacter bethesdensis TaxID=364410 RepID=UPI000B31D364|nr:plasmid mobilization relaxosome protein MobC [Granulibacter bethesdensis]
MPALPGQKMVGTYVPAELAERFEAWARPDGGKAAALRRLIVEAVNGEAEGLHGANPARSKLTPAGVGRGQQIGIRLKAHERRALAEAAEAHGTSPANWVRSLAIVHLTSKPQWNPAESDALRELAREVRAIGNNVNQIARALNVAVQSGVYPPHQGAAARAAETVRKRQPRRRAARFNDND